MDLDHARELDDLLNKVNKGVVLFSNITDEEIRERRIYQYIQRNYGYVDVSNTGFEIKGLGIIALEVNNNKPFEEEYNEKERQKEQLRIDREMLKRDKLQNKLINAAAPIIAVLIGWLFSYFFVRK